MPTKSHSIEVSTTVSFLLYMTHSVDHIESSSRQTPKARVLFVTDPLCSWCFGTLPEVLLSRQKLAGVVSFDLTMAGLQIGTSEGLLGYDIKRLQRLWREVTETTGQTFSGEIPPGFIYHSEMSCRAVEIARQLEGNPPFDFFSKLQTAFYQQGKDINSVKVLAPLLDLPEAELVELQHSPEIIAQTRAGFDLAKSLSANALPHFLIDTGSGYQLLCGGYVTAEYLIPDILQRLSANQT
ncbi:MAG: hypothetical protein ACE37D_12835 [Pseudomonadales bacterium]